MNAPAKFPAASDLGWSDDMRAHRRTISVHCPNCSEIEMAARCRLAALRDNAATGAMRSTDSTAVMLGEVSRLATYAVFAGEPVDKLVRICAALELTMDAARAIERVTRG